MIDLNDLKIALVETKHETACQFNYSIKEIYDALGCQNHGDFYDKLKAHGIKLEHPIKAISQDVLDYLEIGDKYDDAHFDPLTDSMSDYDNGLQNVILNTIYYDVPFTDESTGKVGLKDSCGMIVVPALFDEAVGASDMGFVETLAKVKLNDKYFLTPRDGSGKILTEEGYDEMSRSCAFAWVTKDGKKGMLSSLTGEVIIPCEMDWLINESGLLLRRIFAKEGKVGFAEFNPFNGVLEYYANPVYDAIDLTRNRYRIDGKWVYISNDGQIVDKKSPKFQDVTYWSSPTFYLDYEFRDLPYDNFANFDNRFTRNYPPFVFPTDLTVDERITDALCNALALVNDGLSPVIVWFVVPEEKGGALIGLKFSQNAGKTVIEPMWQSSEQELLFKELTYPNIRCFSCLIKDIHGKFGMQFYRAFSDADFKDIEKLIADYFINHLGLSMSELHFMLTNEDESYTYTETCRLNDRDYKPLQDVGIFVFGENNDCNQKRPHFHVIGNNCDIQIEINEFNELKTLNESHLTDELRRAILDWLPLPSIEIGFTNAELLRFVWNVNNPENKIP